MQTFFANMEAFFPLLFAGGLGWIALWIGASVLYRQSKSKPLYPRKPDRALFFESTGSGHSNRNILTKLGGARNCLSVAVTDSALIVRPTFPFNLVFLPEIYGLEYNIERKNVRSVSEKKSIWGRTAAVAFNMPDGGEQSIELRLRGMDQFLQAMGQR